MLLGPPSPNPRAPIALAAGDVNGDGKLDLVRPVESTNSTDAIVVLLGNAGATPSRWTSLKPMIHPPGRWDSPA